MNKKPKYIPEEEKNLYITELLLNQCKEMNQLKKFNPQFTKENLDKKMKVYRDQSKEFAISSIEKLIIENRELQMQNQKLTEALNEKNLQEFELLNTAMNQMEKIKKENNDLRNKNITFLTKRDQYEKSLDLQNTQMKLLLVQSEEKIKTLEKKELTLQQEINKLNEEIKKLKQNKDIKLKTKDQAIQIQQPKSMLNQNKKENFQRSGKNGIESSTKIAKFKEVPINKRFFKSTDPNNLGNTSFREIN